MPEIHASAPHAVYVPRKGEVNAWDNQLFVKTVRDTGKKTLIMAGVWTSVCVMFPALDAKAAGFKVYAVMDASGDPSEMVSRTTLARFAQAGVIPTSAHAVLCEVHRTWNQPIAAQLAQLWAMQQAYALMPSANFSQDVLESCPPCLAVWALPPITWSDLGTPRRVLAVLRRSRVRPPWLRTRAGRAQLAAL